MTTPTPDNPENFDQVRFGLWWILSVFLLCSTLKTIFQFDDEENEQQLGATASGRKRLFSKELRCMMYGFGDDQNPYTESVDFLEDLVIEFITETTHRWVKLLALFYSKFYTQYYVLKYLLIILEQWKLGEQAVFK